MAEAGTGFLEQLKSCIVWSWTYLWTVWFFIVLFLVYILRVPLKINDNLSTGKAGAAGPPLPHPGKLAQLARGRGGGGSGLPGARSGRPGARASAGGGHPLRSPRLWRPGWPEGRFGATGRLPVPATPRRRRHA